MAHTRAGWEQMRGQRLFVTGGTGFFGCWLLETFAHANRTLNLGAGVTVLTRNPTAFRTRMPHVAEDPSVTLLAGDVRDFAFPEGEYRFVIHAATEVVGSQAADAPMEMLSTILAGTRRTLDFAASHGTAKFLLTSSGAVYGRQPAGMTHVPEDYAGAPDPTLATSVYGEGKRASELMCALYAAKGTMECKIARCWAFCGPHLPLDAQFAIGNFIGDVLAGRPIRIGGDGTPMRSYLYAADLAIWLWRILFDAPSMAAINVGSGEDVSIHDLAETVARALESDVAVEVARQPVPGAEPSRYVPDVKRAAELLGLKPEVGLEDSIRRTAAWHGWQG